MATIIDMPKLSDTMTEGTLVNWLKNEGDKVSSGDMLAEVETDKATMELENFEEGILLKQYVSVGSQVPVGSPICAIGKEGEAVPDAPAPATQEAATPAATEPQPATPAVAPVATPAATPVTAPMVASVDGRIKASPLAKKIAAEKGVALAGLQGSGPGGRIVKADVLNAPVGGSVISAGQTMLAGPVAQEMSQPISNMRSTIARRLVESKTQIPHFYLNIEVDAEPLAKTRAALNAKLADVPAEQGGTKLTVNDFILKATVDALRKAPGVNASWMGTTIQQHGAVHLSFGVAIEEGLVTPVIRDAHNKSLMQISAEAKALVKKARAKKLKPEEMTGSTFTVTNLGMFGVSNFYGIINPPNAGILSVGATEKRPVINEHGEMVIGQRMSIGFSGDHRVVDGATAAIFLQSLKNVLETPAVMLL